MTQVVESQLDEPRTVAGLLSSFAGLALLLATVGVYGVISFNVAARTREIGLRMAFGASPRQILRALLKQGLTTVAVGITIGFLTTALLPPLMSSLLYGIRQLDLTVYVTTALVLTAVAAVAILIPARRAMKVRPAEALRWE